MTCLVSRIVSLFAAEKYVHTAKEQANVTVEACNIYRFRLDGAGTDDRWFNQIHVEMLAFDFHRQDVTNERANS